MEKAYKYYIVASDVLPEIFIKVERARHLLESGRVKTVSEAVAKTGISRSAFYKYKDSVRPFYEMAEGRVVTFQCFLDDSLGVLSNLLSQLAKYEANILTINQSIPINGLAAVTITARTDQVRIKMEQLLGRLKKIGGITKIEILAKM